jgi:RHS repeat-associated protein
MKTIAYALLTILLSTSLALACATRNPTAVITGHQASIEHGTQLTFSGTSSYDNDEGGSRIYNYWWYLDGSYERYGSSYTVTFNLPEGVNERTYAVKLKVRDNDRQYGYKTVYVTVKRPKHFYFYVKDHLGSTRAVVDEAGDVVEAYDYYPFGLQSRSYKEKGDPLTKETFTGKEQDTESNLHYFGARYYDAGAGRWLSVDPLASTQSWAAVSGILDALGNTQSRLQASEDQGPIPEGWYLVDPSQTLAARNASSFFDLALWVLKSYDWGMFATPIFAMDGTDNYAYGRNSSFIHGGKEPGSIGCIDLTKNNYYFHKKFMNHGKVMPMNVTY